MTVAQQFTHADDLIAIWRHYVQSVLQPPDGEADPACKALVADEHTMRMITVACPMTLLMEYRIYDIHSLEQLLETGHRTALTGEETVRRTAHSQHLRTPTAAAPPGGPRPALGTGPRARGAPQPCGACISRTIGRRRR